VSVGKTNEEANSSLGDITASGLSSYSIFSAKRAMCVGMSSIRR
jgi:hypothetical protein